MKKYLCLLLLLLPVVDRAQIITNFAGSGTSLGDGGPATAALVNYPYGGAFDAVGNYYFGESFGSPRIRMVDISGVIHTVAGNGTAGFGGDGGQATAAQLHPGSITVDKQGNIFIADQYNNRIRKVNSTSHIISTIAGTGSPGYSGDGGPASNALLTPGNLCVDTIGNIYFTDVSYRIRKIDTTGIVRTIAGNGTGGGTGYSGDGGQATAAMIGAGVGICLDNLGNLYFGSSNVVRIRKINLITGIINTIAGTGTAFYSGDGMHADSANFAEYGICVDGTGNLYISDYGNYRIRLVDPSGIIHTVVGDGSAGFSGDGGLATAAKINHPEGVATDICGNLYIADETNKRIRKVTYPSTPSLSITTPPAIAIGATVTIAASITGGCCSSYSYLWMKNGVVFSTTITPTVTYTKTNGIDSISAKVVGCGDTTVSIVHVVTSDKTETSLFPSKGGMTCYPNPARGELHIVSPYEMDAVTITDLPGREVYCNSNIGTTERVINTASLTAGVYIIKAYLSGRGVSVGRFVKE